MTSFVKFCFAFILLSFAVVPIYYGVNKEHKIIIGSASNEIAAISAQDDQSLSFADIYDLAGAEEFSPENLNNIAPAAGADTTPEGFSSGFNNYEETNL